MCRRNKLNFDLVTLNMYLKICSIVFCFGIVFYIFNTKGVKDSMSLSTFLFCNFLIAIASIITVPKIFYDVFFKKRQKQ